MVKMLSVLERAISNSQFFCLFFFFFFFAENVSSFCKRKSYSHFLSKNISEYAIFKDQSFNDTLTDDIVSFEQLDPDDFVLTYV